MTEAGEGVFGKTLTTSSELVEWLQRHSTSRRVVVSKDAEGKDYSPLAVVWHAMYMARTPYSGDVYPTDGEIDEEGSFFNEDERAPSGAEPVIALTGSGRGTTHCAGIARDRIGPVMTAQELMALKAATTVLRRYGIADGADLLHEIVRHERAKRSFTP
ncbi:hypothetical protein [Mycobacterium avium]|nr:hypothetical protein [Mycobacterium avium]